MRSLRRYRSPDEDSRRWAAIPLRAGDVVVSTRSKHGTTWLQWLATMLTTASTDPPDHLARWSPWVDWVGEPLDDLVARLASRPGRRVLKTHTPLDGVPLVEGVTYVVGARHPLDAAVSLHHQATANLDRHRIERLTGAPPPAPLPTLSDWLTHWIDADADPTTDLDSLPGVFHHLTDAWGRRDQPGVLLVQYDDLIDDLDGQVARLASAMGVALSAGEQAPIVAAGRFDAMRARAHELAPDPGGILVDPDAFFRRGRSGGHRDVVDDAALSRYHRRTETLAAPDLREWLHRHPDAGRG